MEFMSSFGRLAAALDEAEKLSGERIGGPTEAMERNEAALEARLYECRPERGADWKWLAIRFMDAIECDWSDEALAPLLRLVKSGDDATVPRF